MASNLKERAETLRPKRRRTIVRVASAVLGGALMVGVIRLAPYMSDGDEYTSVESIERASFYQEPTLIEAGWQLPVAQTYQRQAYEYQSNPSFCAPASAANLLQSLGIAMSQTEIIDGTRYDLWFGILVGGLTLTELAELLHLRGKMEVAIIRGSTLEQFRAHLRSSNNPTLRYVVNFHRGPLFGRGHGHFSPILGYLVEKDLVFVGDVNSEYRPFLVPSATLWHATETVDPDSQLKRGLLRVEAASD